MTMANWVGCATWLLSTRRNIYAMYKIGRKKKQNRLESVKPLTKFVNLKFIKNQAWEQINFTSIY